MQSKVTFSGNVLSEEGISPEASNVYEVVKFSTSSCASDVKANHLLYKQRCHQYCWGQQRVLPSWLVKYIGRCLLLSNQFLFCFICLLFYLFLARNLIVRICRRQVNLNLRYIYNKWLALNNFLGWLHFL